MVYFFLKISDRDFILPYLANNPIDDSGSDLKYTGEYNVGKIVIIAVLNIMLIIGILIKITYFMQVNEELGIVIRLVTLTVWQSSYFIVFYNLCIIALSIIFKLAGFEIENQQDDMYSDEDYPLLGSAFKFFIMVLRISIGDI